MSSVSKRADARPKVVYPDCDGEPMSDNTLQFRWIVTIKEGLEAIFRDRPDVFVAGDLLWYPVEGENTIRSAPDAMVVFGRPKGYRGSYRQFEEEGIAPQVVFEVLSPGNRTGKMIKKFQFYEHHGVEEYYVYDPDDPELSGWLRRGDRLEEIAEVNGWVSPRLGVRFDMSGPELVIYGPDGRPLLTYVELAEERDAAERGRAEAERDRDAERTRAERLAERLRELGVDPEG
jgi:Uma2 family endonuclease